MKVDIKNLKINMIVNLTRDYLVLRKNAQVGVAYNDETLYVTIASERIGCNFTIDIGYLLDNIEVETLIVELIEEIEIQLED